MFWAPTAGNSLEEYIHALEVKPSPRTDPYTDPYRRTFPYKDSYTDSYTDPYTDPYADPNHTPHCRAWLTVKEIPSTRYSLTPFRTCLRQ